MKPKSLLTSFDPPPSNKKQNKTKQKQKQTSLSGNKKNEVCLEGKNAMKIYHYKQQTGFSFLYYYI